MPDLARCLAEAYDLALPHRGKGKVADYIPALARVDPMRFGMALALPDGTLPEAATTRLERLGTWYRSVREALEKTVPCSHLAANSDVLLTRRDDTLYVILHADPKGDAVKLKPLDRLPRRATLLNTGAPVRCSLDLVPSEHGTQGRYLRLTRLPVNEHAATVLVAKLEFDSLPATLAPARASGASIL